MSQRLDGFLRPRHLAIIGASDREGSTGFTVMENMLDAGFQGHLYPVNLRHATVQGNKAYRHIGDVPGQVDLAVICTPLRTLERVVEECGEAGVKGLLILTSGFREAGEEGADLFNRLKRLSRSYGMRIVGPGSLGYQAPHQRIHASAMAQMPLQGNLALISQSGALLTAVLDWATQQNVGFSTVLSMGAMMDVHFADLIDFLGGDANTSCVLLYMESMKDARRFISAARAFSRSKPIIVLKAGRSTEGSEAALSHTGNLAGNDAAFDAAFARVGVVRVETIAQLFNMAQALAMQPRPNDNRLAIVTNAGGPAVLATDYLIRAGGRLATLKPETLEDLQPLLPAHRKGGNPVNLGGEAGPEAYQQAVKSCLQDYHTDGLVVILTPQAATDPKAAAEAVVAAARHAFKPVLAVWMGETGVWEGREVLEQGRIPHYRFPESAVDVFVRMYQYDRSLRYLYETPAAIPDEFKPDRDGARAILREVTGQGRRQLTEVESKRLMQCYALPVGQYALATTPAEAAEAGAAIGFPVAMKVISPDIGHKTDLDGIALNVGDPAHAREAFERIRTGIAHHQPEAEFQGVLIERMIPTPVELFIGAKKDPQFGPVIALGQGGVGVEVFRDFGLGLPPLNMALAQRMMRGLRMYPLLEKYHRAGHIRLEELCFSLCKFAYLLMDFPEIREIDINPFVPYRDSWRALDAHVVLEGSPPPEKRKAYDHLVISPYPMQYVREARLRDGRPITLRPIRPEDEPLEEKMIRHLSDQSLYFRFFGQIPKVSHEWLSRFTHIDYDREMAIIAELEEAGERHMIGVVRLIEDPWGETAEYAIAVADPWQGQGLGNLLTDFILEIARDRGLKKVYASVLATNKRMVHMFERRGFDLRREDFESYFVELDLSKQPAG